MTLRLKNIVPSVVLILMFVLFLSVLSDRASIYTVSFVIIVSLFEYVKGVYKTDDVFYPKYALLVLFYLYSLAGILVVEGQGVDGQGTTIPDYIVDKYTISCLVGLVGLCLGFMINLHKNNGQLSRGPKFDEGQVNKILAVFVMFALVINFSSILAKYNFLTVESYADRALSYRLERRESLNSGLYEVFLVDSPVLIINYFCIRKFFLLKKTDLLRYLYLVPYLFCILTALLSGFRSSLVSIALPFIFIYHYKVSPFKMTINRAVVYILLGTTVYIFINLLALVRGSSDPVVMIEMLVDNVQRNGFAFLRLDKSGELETSVNFMRLILGIDNHETGFTYGKSFIDEVLVYIPLSFYPNRPHPISERFVMTFYPKIHEMGGGMGQFCLLEGYWALGNLGVLLTSFLYSHYLVRFYKYLKPALGGSFILILLYSQVFDKSVVAMVRGGYLGSVKACIISTIVIIVAIFLSKLKLKESK